MCCIHIAFRTGLSGIVFFNRHILKYILTSLTLQFLDTYNKQLDVIWEWSWKEKLSQHFKISLVYKWSLTLPAWHTLWRKVYVKCISFWLYRVCIIIDKLLSDKTNQMKILLKISDHKLKLLTNENNSPGLFEKTQVQGFL